jgi:phosphoribosylamine-glycine ligase
LADDKIKTKEFLQSRDIPVGRTFAKISTREQMEGFDFTKIPSEHFVIKPNKGSQGKGIQIVTRVDSDEEGGVARYVIQGESFSDVSLRYLMRDILDGKFSITGNSDSVLIEEKLVPNAEFSKYCEHGLADIRIIVFNLVPVAAMLRMPTEAS